MPADVLAPGKQMTPTAVVAAATAAVAEPQSWRERLRAYHELAKPNLTFLVILTGVFGFYLGSDGFAGLDALNLVAFIAGTAMTAGGACALNMYIERAVDARMRRTAKRPLPSGRVPAAGALAFSVLNVVVGTVVLAVVCGLIPAGLGLLTAILYGFVYTPLKKLHGPLAVVVGAVPGAVPPVMGWAAARGTIGWEGFALFTIVFAWQFPHFVALAYMYREDYARGGFHFLPRSNAVTSAVIFLGTLAVLGASAGPYVLGLASWLYLAGAIAAGVVFLRSAYRTLVRLDGKSARSVFLISITYLPVLLGLILIDGLLLG